MSLPAGIDLSSLLASQPTFTPQPAMMAPSNGLAQAKPKKKAPTADEKREKEILTVLLNQDPFGLTYAKLLLQMDAESLEERVRWVKYKNGLP